MTSTSRTVRDTLEQRLDLAGTEAARHAFTQLLPQSARAEADAADARRRAGLSLGPLDGVIISVKDLFDMQGCVTTAGSQRLESAPPATVDAPCIARLRQAGAVLIGRTNMTEFAFSGLGLNPHWGTPGSACDPLRIPGGSTSGGAVSVGLRIADITIGSDTGGSTRIPAAFNGIVGFKPTSPRIPKDGAFPLSFTLDSVGPLAGTVAGCALADAAMSGEWPQELQPRSVKGLRIGVPKGSLMEGNEAAVDAAFAAACERLGQAGARIETIDIEDMLAQMRIALSAAPIVASEAAAIHADAMRNEPAAFDPRVLARIRLGATVPAAAYIATMRAREALMARFAHQLAPFDVMLLPTCPITPPLIAALEADDALFTETNLKVLRNTSVANFFDCPSLSLPLPVKPLPVGLMLVGHRFGDAALFQIGAAIEAELAHAAPLA
jgi:aspartyl-tRNA(Asn)/glutamyl-tRNA(Gln) amidotransferase subunit A